MTKDDVISAAFSVWGRDLYKNTSLAKLADTLGVTKPALYRHFSDKNALFDAMENRFLDEYAASLVPVIEKAKAIGPWQERLLFVVRSMTVYFASNEDFFIFSMIRIHGDKDHFIGLVGELEKRGVSFTDLKQGLPLDNQYPSIIQLCAITSVFGTALFYKKTIHSKTVKNSAAENCAEYFSNVTAEILRQGLRFNRSVIDALDFDKLEAARGKFKIAPGDPLLAAVAEAVAKAGPWDASMEDVARISGLSKSGLYAHFKSKNDMLSRLFMTEFERIAGIVEEYSGLAETREGQLYLAFLSITDYLKARPEILVALDWVRVQRLDLDIDVPAKLDDFFAVLKLEGHIETKQKPASQTISRWLLFLLVNTLIRKLHKGKINGVSKESIRKLFRFATLGIEGWNA